MVQGGTPPLHLILNNKSINNFQNKIFLEDGIHQIQIIDDNNCLLLKNFEITKSKRGSIDIPQDTIYLTVGDSFEVKLNIKDIDQIDTIDWNGNSKFSCKNCEDPFITPLKDQIKIQVKLIDSNGCEYIDFVIFRLKQKVTVPNVFSPNGDGLNDFFTLISDSSVEKINSLKIFDRWGELIFESKDAIPNSSIGAWDGTFRNEPINPGVYVYLISYQNKIGDIFTIAGDITLLK
ncbi:MAG: gliding motility-associated C-terminal domain-containing protein [Saprospiraceae bacterium]|nr:gliding motility-associated C-terminal domain-containing protein [Saprospiraceae bacterium]